jgi:hypothetical protein
MSYPSLRPFSFFVSLALWEVQSRLIEQIEEKASDGEYNHSQYYVFHRIMVLFKRTL